VGNQERDPEVWSLAFNPDRTLLAAESQAAANQAVAFISPRSDVERRVAKIWRQILDAPRIGVHDPFRRSGGDSLLATIIHTRIEQEFSIDVPLVDLYAAPTVADQAALIEDLLASQD
jgi:acyl carrier protein